MDFFAAQEDARRRTVLLVVLFALAVAGVVFAVYLVVSFVMPFWFPSLLGFCFWDGERLAWISAGTLALILGGSLYKAEQLRARGGPGVAEMLGGRRVAPDTEDFLERRLLNVVEEMAIASGMPAPPVYVLEEAGINAFAVGFSPRDAAVGVTRGAMELLTREQLQGVIAHEFSHLVHGDSRISTRLIGMLFGITLVSHLGREVMQLAGTMSARRRGLWGRRAGPGWAALALGLLGGLLVLVGLVGEVLADLIRLAISRQREFLADAAAVQFTRNPAGLAGALKNIGGYAPGGRVAHPAARQASHLFFCEALARRLWSSHPPLEARIRRLDPSFDGRFAPVDAEALAASVRREAELPVSFAAEKVLAARMRKAGDFTAHAGAVSPEYAALARELMARLPEMLRRLAHEPRSARAIVYVLLLDAHREVRRRQLALLQEKVEAEELKHMVHLVEPRVMRLDAELRWTLVQILFPALLCQTEAQYHAFRETVEALIRADGRIRLFEYGVRRVLLARLDAAFGNVHQPGVRHHRLTEVLDAARVLLGALAWAGADDEAAAQRAFQCAMQVFLVGRAARVPLPARGELGLRALDAALDRWEVAAPALKKRLLEAAAASVMVDGRVHEREIELLRVLAASLDCPVPPLAASQSEA